MRYLLSAFLLIAAQATAQEWTDTRAGSYDFICETTVGVFVSGHQRFSLAARSCATAAAANPGTDYQVRPATYKIALVAAPANKPTPAPTQFALALDPMCTAIVPLETTVGVAFVSPSLRSCLSGTEAATAVPSLLRVSGDDLAANGVVISADAKVSMPGTKAASGKLSIRFATTGGVMLDFERSWQVQP